MGKANIAMMGVFGAVLGLAKVDFWPAAAVVALASIGLQIAKR